MNTNAQKYIKPMLATLTQRVFENSNWIYEPKYDGFRAIAHTGRKIRLYSRNQKPFEPLFPSIVKELKEFKFEAVFDGEIIAFEKGKKKSSFGALQNVQLAEKVKYIVFDLLFLNRLDLRTLAWTKRRETLEKIFVSTKNIRLSRYKNEGIKYFKTTKKQGYEGIIAKRKQSIYQSEKRSRDWLKIKHVKKLTAIIVGYTEPYGGRAYFGSLVLGANENGGIIHLGNVGTGFTAGQEKKIFERLQRIKTANRTIKREVNTQRKIYWVLPKITAEIKYSELTADKKLRIPVFMGIREDLDPKEAIVEKPYNPPRIVKVGQKIHKYPFEIMSGERKIQITNPGKIYFPKSGLTKEDLVRYYYQNISLIFPYLKNRPMVLNRYPNGIKGESFYQKDIEVKPDWVKTMAIGSGSKKEAVNYLVCTEEAALIYMVQLGCIEMHTFNTTYDKPEMTDLLIIDLDPGDVAFELVKKIARAFLAIATQLKLKVFLKTSGLKGLHLFIPLGASYPESQVKQLADALALFVYLQNPKITTMQIAKSARKGKILIDTDRNNYKQTVVSPYSVRPAEYAPVSMTIDWENLEKIKSADQFKMNEVKNWLKYRKDPWYRFFTAKVDIADTIKSFRKINLANY